jgi:hypothetical protein
MIIVAEKRRIFGVWNARVLFGEVNYQGDKITEGEMPRICSTPRGDSQYA